MSFHRISKLPAWLRPLPPIAILGAAVVLGYGCQNLPFSEVSTSESADVRDMPPGASLGDPFTFQAPGTPSSKPAQKDAVNPGQLQGGMTQPPMTLAPDSNSNSAQTLNQPLHLAPDSVGAAELQKFRNSPLAQTYGKALEAQKQGKLDEAIQGYRAILHQIPDALPAHLNLAVAYLQANQPDKAIPHLQVVAKADPKNVKVQFELAKVLLNQNRLNEAVVPLQQTIKLMPQNPQPRMLLAQLYFSQKDYSRAFDQWVALDKIDAGNGQAAFAAGTIALRNLKNPQKALPWLRKAHRLAPSEDNVTLLLGQTLASTGNTKDAEPLLSQIVTKAPNNADLVRMLAQVQWQNKHQDAAINTLKKVIALNPKDKDAKAMLGEALGTRADSQEKAHKLAEASETWKQVQQLFPDNQLPLIKRAFILRQLNRDDEAKVLFKQVLKKAPKDPNALFGVASIAIKQKDYSGAYQDFWQAIQANPDYAPAYEGFLLAADKTHQEKDAYLLLQKWVKAHPRLDEAQKALKALGPAANRPPELTPLNKAPDINTDRPPTVQIPGAPSKQPAPPQKNNSSDNSSASTTKPQMTPVGKASTKSRISPVKPSQESAPTAASPAPELTIPQQ